MRPLLRHLPVAIAPAILLLAARASAAPTVAFGSQAPLRIASDGTTQIPTLIVHGNQQGINFKECTDDTFIRFFLTTTGLPTSDSLQAWAGTGDCTQPNATQTSQASCWPIHNGAITPQLAFSIDLRIQDIVSQLFASTKVTTYSAATSQVCSTAAASSTTTTTNDAGQTVVASGETTVNIFFMWFPGGANAPEASAPAFPIKVKLVGPNAPTNVVASGGDGEIIVTWNAPAGEADLQGFHIFASPSGATSDAGGDVTTVCSDAAQGTQLFDDAGNPVYDDAGNAVFVDDAGNPVSQDAGCYQVYTPPSTGGSCSGGTVDTSNICGDGGASGSCTIEAQVNGNTNAGGNITGLANGTSYAVAVSAFDSFQNDGTLSAAVCATPAPIDDFWKRYHEEGGTATGCAIQAVGGMGSIPVGALGLIVAGALLARHRRRRLEENNDEH